MTSGRSSVPRLRAPAESMVPWRWYLALVFFGAAIRVLVLLLYSPDTGGDTPTYFSAARDLVVGDFTAGEGRRTPGYPVFLLLTGENLTTIVGVQMLVGIGISLVLFATCMRLCAVPVVAFGVALAYSLNLQQLFLEAAALTETLTTLLVAATLLALLIASERLRDGRPASAATLAAGVLAAAAIMVRPQFLYFIGLLPLLMLAAAHRSPLAWMHRAGLAALVAAPAVFAVLGWSAVVQAKTGHFTLSTQSGFGVVNHSVEFIELAPERYAVVRDILLAHRAEMVREKGHAGNTVWFAWPAIQRATGWSLAQASNVFKTMSAELFAAHPILYAESVAIAWLQFWTVPISWDLKKLESPALAQALVWIWWLEHKLLRAANLAFVLLFAAVVLSRNVRQAVRWDFGLTAISLVIFGSSVLQALADRGAGSRYAVTVQALILLVLAVSAVRWRLSARSRAGSGSLPIDAPATGRHHPG